MQSSKIAENEWKYPKPEAPNSQGLLDVSNGHRIFWHEYGHPQGEPVLIVHGGPGGNSQQPDLARFFDPERYRIIAFDQRGCGKSEPSVSTDPKAGLAHNTTDDSIADIGRLRVKLHLTGKMHVFGGSWGSTLSLAYAIHHPEHVKSLALRGIFLVRKKDIDYFYQGNAAGYAKDPLDTQIPGAYAAFPEAWKDFVEVISPEKRGDMVKAYAEIFARTPQTPTEEMLQTRAATAWSVWEGATSYLAQDLRDLSPFAEPRFAKTFARIENHYFMNGGFLGGKGEGNRDNDYLLQNVERIKDIPIRIVQGRYDQVCPRFQADALVAALERCGAKEVEYVVTAAGHSALERETALALTKVMDEMPKLA